MIELASSGDDYPSQSAEELIPRADIVALTGDTLINHTLDGLLRLCHSNALVILLGPTTSLSPGPFEHGVDIIAGSLVVDEDAVLHAIGRVRHSSRSKGFAC